MDGSLFLVIRQNTSLARRCRKGAIHPIIRSPRRRARAVSVRTLRPMSFLGGLEDQAEQEMHVGAVGSAFRRGPLSRGPYLTLAKRFSRVSGTRHKVSVFKVRERREPFGLSLRPSRGYGDRV